MFSPEGKEFTDKVLKHIKFPYDRNAVRQELEEHIEDICDDLTEEGYGREEAERLSVQYMGDADEIGRELNKAHNPILGWIWYISRLAATIAAAFLITTAGVRGFSYMKAYFGNGYEDYKNGELVYSADSGYETLIYDMHLKIDGVRYYDDGTLELRYKTWKSLFSDSIDWTFNLNGEFLTDEKGNKYYFSTGNSNGNKVCHSQLFFEDFPQDVKTIIIDTDVNGQNIHCEIPVPEVNNK